MVVFSCTSFPNILNAETTNDTFQQSGKQDSFPTHIEEFSQHV